MLNKQPTHAVGWALHDGSLVQVFVEYQEFGQVSPAEISRDGAQVGGQPWLPARWQHGSHRLPAQAPIVACALISLRLLEPCPCVSFYISECISNLDLVFRPSIH